MTINLIIHILLLFISIQTAYQCLEQLTSLSNELACVKSMGSLGKTDLKHYCGNYGIRTTIHGHKKPEFIAK